jgi:ribonuclease III
MLLLHDIARNFEEFESSIGYVFNRLDLLISAFTHPSTTTGEAIRVHDTLGIRHNQRLEFLGDAVLQLVASEFVVDQLALEQDRALCSGTQLKERLFENRVALVSNAALEQVALDLGVIRYARAVPPLFVVKDNQTRKKALSDIVESLIAALFLDGNFSLSLVKAFCRATIFGRNGKRRK